MTQMRVVYTFTKVVTWQYSILLYFYFIRLKQCSSLLLILPVHNLFHAKYTLKKIRLSERIKNNNCFLLLLIIINKMLMILHLVTLMKPVKDPCTLRLTQCAGLLPALSLCLLPLPFLCSLSFLLHSSSPSLRCGKWERLVIALSFIWRRTGVLESGVFIRIYL